MFKKIVTTLLSAALACTFVACGNNVATTTTEKDVAEEDTTEDREANTLAEGNESDSNAASEEGTVTGNDEISFTVNNTLAEDEEALVNTYTDKFEQLEYTDEETGLSITYNLYLPENYDESKEYPMVVFIGDSTTAGTDAEYSLTQGLGGLVWATSEWQSVYETIVAVPTYPETILDDHDGYSTTEYVELTKRFIDYMTEEYAVDTNRIYGTGQSMGCMTTLILASEYPDLYASCMFVDGQWDTELLSNLEGQTFVYFAAEDDASAWSGMQELMERFDEDSVTYTYAQWDGTWSSDERTAAAEKLFSEESSGAYFISWATGTIDAGSGNSPMSGNTGFGENGEGEEMARPESDEGNSEKPEMLEGEIASSEMSGEKPEGMTRRNGGNGGGAGGGATYHMASFDYAYSSVAVMDWLFQQTK